MNEEFAWFLGTLLSDGSITIPKYRSKGDETHIQYCIHIKDVECLHKIKEILGTSAIVHEYPNYKSPQCRLRVYDRKDITTQYANIKSEIPSDIQGYERHFIRGIVDGDGCLNYRPSRDTFRINIINEKLNIVQWCAQAITDNLGIPYKEPKHVEYDHIYKIEYEGRVGCLIAWWLYHGDIDNCVLKRKYDYYKHYVLHDIDSIDNDETLLEAVKCIYINENHISPNINASKTLEWCHYIQRQLSFNTVPVFHNKGKIKYYELYIPQP